MHVRDVTHFTEHFTQPWNCKNPFYPTIRSLPNGNFSDWTKFEAFAEDKFRDAKTMIPETS